MNSYVAPYAKQWLVKFHKAIGDRYGDKMVIFISHNRIFNSPSCCMSKSKFQKAHPETLIKDSISQYGGYTKVQIVVDGNVVSTAKHNFGKNENFCRSLGAMVAIRKAMSTNADYKSFANSIR